MFPCAGLPQSGIVEALSDFYILLSGSLATMADDSALLRCLWAVRFTGMLSNALLIPILPTLLETPLGVRRYGLLQSVCNGGALLMAAWFGRLFDRRGRTVALFACALTLLVGIGSIGVGHALGGVGWALAIACGGRVLQAVGHRSMGGVVQAATRGGAHNAALVRSAVGIGFASGNALGGWLASFGMVVPLATALLSAAGTCGVVVTTTLVAGSTGAAAKAPADEPVEQKSAPPPKLRLREMVTARVGALLLVQHLGGVAFHLYTSTWGVCVRERLGYTPAQFGFMLGFIGWSFALINLLVVPRLVKLSSSDTQMLRVGLLLSAAARFLQGAANSTAQLMAANVLLALGRASASTLTSHLIATAAPPAQRGSLLGVSESVLDAAGVYAPLLSSWLVEAYGTSAPAFAAGVVSLGALGCACFALSDDAAAANAVPTVGAVPATAAAVDGDVRKKTD